MATSVTTTDGVLLIIKDVDATHQDSVKDQRGCYKRGDPVHVLPGTHPLVLPPSPPFYIVRIIDVAVEQALKFQNQWRDAGGVPVTRRLYACEVDNLQTSIRTELIADRYIEVTLNQVRNQLRNKQTGATE